MQEVMRRCCADEAMTMKQGEPASLVSRQAAHCCLVSHDTTPAGSSSTTQSAAAVTPCPAVLLAQLALSKRCCARTSPLPVAGHSPSTNAWCSDSGNPKSRVNRLSPPLPNCSTRHGAGAAQAQAWTWSHGSCASAHQPCRVEALPVVPSRATVAGETAADHGCTA